MAKILLEWDYYKFLFEEHNECGYINPDNVITIPFEKITF